MKCGVSSLSDALHFLYQAIFRVYPLPPDPNEALPPKVITNLPGSVPEECIIRVYVVEAMELAAMDPNGLVSITCSRCHVTYKHIVTFLLSLLNDYKLQLTHYVEVFEPKLKN
jgi:hypothetical protein